MACLGPVRLSLALVVVAVAVAVAVAVVLADVVVHAGRQRNANKLMISCRREECGQRMRTVRFRQ